MSNETSLGGLESVVYNHRFELGHEKRSRVWKILCDSFFKKWIPKQSTLVEVASGYGYFINSAQASKKIALDINPNSKAHLEDVVDFHHCDVTKALPLADDSVDRLFMSNFLEHIDKPSILRVLRETFRVLKPGGRVLVLQPNFKYCSTDYFRFFDHHTAIDHHSLKEALEIVGFKVEKVIPRFLPYTMEGKLPTPNFLISVYLKCPWLWPFFGKQCFAVAKK